MSIQEANPQLEKLEKEGCRADQTGQIHCWEMQQFSMKLPRDSNSTPGHPNKAGLPQERNGRVDDFYSLGYPNPAGQMLCLQASNLYHLCLAHKLMSMPSQVGFGHHDFLPHG
eukprot:1139405-Pelagomonas_calceolata.AAC.2